MNVALRQRMTLEEVLAWEEQQRRPRTTASDEG